MPLMKETKAKRFRFHFNLPLRTRERAFTWVNESPTFRPFNFFVRSLIKLDRVHTVSHSLVGGLAVALKRKMAWFISFSCSEKIRWKNWKGLLLVLKAISLSLSSEWKKEIDFLRFCRYFLPPTAPKSDHRNSWFRQVDSGLPSPRSISPNKNPDPVWQGVFSNLKKIWAKAYVMRIDDVARQNLGACSVKITWRGGPFNARKMVLNRFSRSTSNHD